jgi:hypothetical protein
MKQKSWMRWLVSSSDTKAYLQMRDGPFQPEPFGPRANKT